MSSWFPQCGNGAVQSNTCKGSNPQQALETFRPDGGLFLEAILALHTFPVVSVRFHAELGVERSQACQRRGVGDHQLECW